MTTKISVTVSDPAHAFARMQVEEGRYPNLSAMVNAGLTRLREDEEARLAMIDALSSEIRRRANTPTDKFVDFDAAAHRSRAEALVANRKKPDPQ